MFTEKLDEVMAKVELFYAIYDFPMTNGINFRTNMFKEELSFEEFSSHFYIESAEAYKSFQEISKQVNSFEKLLKEFVATDDFENTWKNMSDKQRSYLIYFDESSYGILRNKISKRDVIKIDWKEIIDDISPKWDDKFSSALGLPPEFITPPENRLQALKQKKALLQHGYSEKDVALVFSSMDIRPDLMAKNLLNVVVKKSDDLESLFNNLGAPPPYWLHYKIDFINEQEKKLSGGSRPRM